MGNEITERDRILARKFAKEVVRVATGNYNPEWPWKQDHIRRESLALAAEQITRENATYREPQAWLSAYRTAMSIYRQKGKTQRSNIRQAIAESDNVRRGQYVATMIGSQIVTNLGDEFKAKKRQLALEKKRNSTLGFDVDVTADSHTGEETEAAITFTPDPKPATPAAQGALPLPIPPSMALMNPQGLTEADLFAPDPEPASQDEAEPLEAMEITPATITQRYTTAASQYDLIPSDSLSAVLLGCSRATATKLRNRLMAQGYVFSTATVEDGKIPGRYYRITKRPPQREELLAQTMQVINSMSEAELKRLQKALTKQ